MILVGGEALYDLVVQGDGDDLRGHPGGGPFNTARTVGRLGQPVAYLGRLSSDRFGRRLEELLSDDGVRLDSVVHTDEPTTLAVAEVDREGVARYRFYERATAATRRSNARLRPARRARRRRWVEPSAVRFRGVTRITVLYGRSGVTPPRTRPLNAEVDVRRCPLIPAGSPRRRTARPARGLAG